MLPPSSGSIVRRSHARKEDAIRRRLPSSSSESPDPDSDALGLEEAFDLSVPRLEERAPEAGVAGETVAMLVSLFVCTGGRGAVVVSREGIQSSMAISVTGLVLGVVSSVDSVSAGE